MAAPVRVPPGKSLHIYKTLAIFDSVIWWKAW